MRYLLSVVFAIAITLTVILLAVLTNDSFEHVGVLLLIGLAAARISIDITKGDE